MITEDVVKKVAKLAKLEIKKEDVAKLTEQLSGILSFIETINELKLEDVKPTAHAVEVNNVFREDVARSSDVTQKTLDKAPEGDGEFFRVPKVL